MPTFRSIGPFAICLIIATASGVIRADTVTLKNGDKINGKVGLIAGGKMKFSSPVLGDITIDMANVETFTTDEPATIQQKKAPVISEKIESGNAEQVSTADGKTIPFAQVKSINAPKRDWTGSIVALGELARGNTETFDVGVAIAASLRRDDEIYDDRFSLGGGYNFGTTGTGSNTTTSTDNWNAMVKYDKFWTDKLYGYVQMAIDHDRIAGLTYRLTPGIGVGYQWIEQPTMNFRTEAGISWVYEEFDAGGNNDYAAARLAYHFDKKLNDKLTLFHNLVYLPSFEDPGEYNLNTDAGFRCDLIKNMFAEFKFVWERDSTPAEGAQKNDLRYIAGIGWSF